MKAPQNDTQSLSIYHYFAKPKTKKNQLKTKNFKIKVNVYDSRKK